MSMTPDQMTNGLTLEHDLFFAEKPDDPEMRESTSIWLFEENGAFALPRIGIEAEAKAWDNRVHQANFALGGGRLLDGIGAGPGPSPFGPDGSDVFHPLMKNSPAMPMSMSLLLRCRVLANSLRI
jgi:hypothetical protein